jgi:hypothetical protein
MAGAAEPTLRVGSAFFSSFFSSLPGMIFLAGTESGCLVAGAAGAGAVAGWAEARAGEGGEREQRQERGGLHGGILAAGSSRRSRGPAHSAGAESLGDPERQV